MIYVVIQHIEDGVALIQGEISTRSADRVDRTWLRSTMKVTLAGDKCQACGKEIKEEFMWFATGYPGGEYVLCNPCIEASELGVYFGDPSWPESR